jgi:hypothetical protein
MRGIQVDLTEGNKALNIAVSQDKAGRYTEAKEYYKKALSHFNLYLTQAPTTSPPPPPQLVQTVQARVEECSRRLSQLHSIQTAQPQLQPTAGGQAQKPRWREVPNEIAPSPVPAIGIFQRSKSYPRLE